MVTPAAISLVMLTLAVLVAYTASTNSGAGSALLAAAWFFVLLVQNSN